VRAKRVDSEIPVNPFTAGVYIAVMMATVQTLQEKGHPFSEICNEVGRAHIAAHTPLRVPGSAAGAALDCTAAPVTGLRQALLAASFWKELACLCVCASSAHIMHPPFPPPTPHAHTSMLAHQHASY
jgi:hypothetical protein